MSKQDADFTEAHAAAIEAAKRNYYKGWALDESGRMIQPVNGNDPYARRQEPGVTYRPIPEGHWAVTR